MFELLLGLAKDDRPYFPDSGPGSKVLVKYEEGIDTGYFGRIAPYDMPTIDQIESVSAVALGGARTAFASSITWTKYTKNGKVFYYPDNSVRSGITWDNVYQAGFVYGTNDNGKFPEANTPTNQLRKFVFTDRDGIAWEFKVRLPQLVTIDKFADSQLSNSTFARESEFSTTFARTHGFTDCPVIWDNIARPASGALGAETNSNFAAQSDYVSTAIRWGVFSRQAKGTAIGQCQWFPVLELIGKFVPPQGQVEWTTPGTYEWTVPEGVNEVAVMIYSAGEQGKASFGNSVTGGKGGQNRWKNNIPVIPGEKYSIVVGSGGTNETLAYGASRNAQAVSVSKSSAFGIEVTPTTGTVIGENMGGNGGPYGASTSALNTTVKGGDAPTFTTSPTTIRSYGQSMLNVPVPPTGYDGGTCGAGGSSRTGASETGSATKPCGKGGDGGVRIMWGPGRSYPNTKIADV